MTDGNPDDFLMVWGGEEAQGHQAGAGEAWTESEALHRGERFAAGGAQGALRGHLTVFTGQLSGDELSSAFASADAFMMPSDSGEFSKSTLSSRV